jgi:glycosyltransferase involved in cell wall biosynthesis
MPSEESSRVIVVLGMHRGGTSIVARALNLLGIELGDDLLSAAPDNPTGYWESRTVLTINEAVLTTFGMTWDSVIPIDPNNWELPKIKELQLDALDKLRKKFRNARLWGFKDPRTARLLPFWQRVFRHLNVTETYVIALRNPLNVVKSLAAPDRVNPYPPSYRQSGFSSRKGYILWLEHMVSAVAYTEANDRVLVDTDRLYSYPSAELKRLAERLQLSSAPNLNSALEEFETRFLDSNLRHGHYEADDVALDPHAPAVVTEAYRYFRALAHDLNSDSATGNFSAIESWLRDSAPALALSSELDRELVSVCIKLMNLELERDDLIEQTKVFAKHKDLLDRQLDEAHLQLDEAQRDRDRRDAEASRERAEAEERYESLSSELMAEIAGLKGNLGALEQQHNETSWRLELASKELNEIVASPGWGVIQRYRGWVARQRQVRPRLFARYEKLALSMLWRLGGKRGFDRAGVHEVVGPVSAEENLKRDTKSRSIEVDISKFVLILSGGPDVSYRYRAEHQAEEFGLLGLTADAALFNTVDYGRVWQQYRAFILHRVPYTPEIEDFIKRAKAAGKPVIFDTDDLVFNEALIGEIKAIRDFSPEEFSLHLEGIKRYYRTLSLCQAALVTTEELRDRIKELFHEMPVYVNRNAVSDEMVGRADAAIKHISKVDDGAVRAIYMSGTRTHNEDFVQCVGALARLMQSYPQLRLMIAGLLDLPEVLRNWIDRIEFIPLLPFEELPRLMRRADINLAPLELNNAFTHCKSELKYFEAGLLGLPTVASRVPVFQNAITPGENGFLCKSEQDWFEAIERLICSPELRRRIGSRAREDVLERFTTRSRAPELTQTLRRIFDDLGLAGPRRLSVAIVTQAPIAQTGGGYKNIFRIGNWLADHGHDVHIYVEAVAHLAGLTDAEIVAFCHCYFGSSAAQIHVGHDQILASDVALATAFPTAFTVNNLTNTRCKAYLIQDFEPEFFETSDPSYDSAERTYDLPLKKIALGKYLQNLFSKRDRVPVEQIPFALDSSNFRNLALRPQSPIRVLFFARPGMKRRAYPVGVAALRILARTHPEVEIAFYGMREPEELGFRYQNLGELSPEQLSREMNRSHIHLSFSLTNISWVPLEAMASGCAVLEAKVPSVTMWTETEADAEVPCLLAEPNPPAVADALINLVNDHHLRQRLSEHGQRFAAAVCTSWDKTCQQIEKIFLRTVLREELTAANLFLAPFRPARTPPAQSPGNRISDFRASHQELAPPVIIGGTGGSGTRVVARIVRAAGTYIGTRLNESEDSVDFAEFSDKWINRYIRQPLDPLTDTEMDQMQKDFAECLRRHRLELGDANLPWGWKEPRSIYLLPFFHDLFPQLRFIHLVRDGRDLAFSPNQNQLRKHGQTFFEDKLIDAPQAVRTVALWSIVNLAAASYGEGNLGQHYLRLKFEELCSTPEVAARQIFSLLGSSSADTSSAIAEIRCPETIGRWRSESDRNLLAEIEYQAHLALEKFDYR